MKEIGLGGASLETPLDAPLSIHDKQNLMILNS